MNDCIYTPYCLRTQCDMACPKRAEILYWLSHCDIRFNNRILHAERSVIDNMSYIIQRCLGKVVWLPAKKPADVTDLIAYCCICLYGEHKAFSNGIYVLDFAEYIDTTKRSWQMREEPESLEMMRLWTNNAQYLVISNLDYISFKDFESQTLLRLIQDREKQRKTTFIVTSKSDPLVGNGQFFTRLTAKLKEVEFK